MCTVFVGWISLGEGSTLGGMHKGGLDVIVNIIFGNADDAPIIGEDSE